MRRTSSGSSTATAAAARSSRGSCSPTSPWARSCWRRTRRRSSRTPRCKNCDLVFVRRSRPPWASRWEESRQAYGEARRRCVKREIDPLDIDFSQLHFPPFDPGTKNVIAGSRLTTRHPASLFARMPLSQRTHLPETTTSPRKSFRGRFERGTNTLLQHSNSHVRRARARGAAALESFQLASALARGCA